MATSIQLDFQRDLLEHSRKARLEKIKLFFPVILGTIIEYYDYALYGFCAVFLAQAFFPANDPSVALLKTFGVFVAGFLSKPMGALIFGFIGDRVGRSLALKISIIGIAIPTTLIGIIPTYESIGWKAPLLLLFCRIFQGIFLSGEYDGARIFIFESVGKGHPNFANSLTNVAGMLGYYLASVAASLVLDPDLPKWSWRLPFVFSGVMGLFVFCLRCSMNESTEFKNYLTHSPKLPIKSFSAIFIKNRQALLATILLFGAVGGGYHFYFTFLGSFLGNVLNIISPEQAAVSTSKAVLMYTLFGPIAGLAADRYGAVLVFKRAALFLLALTLLNILMIYQGAPSAWIILFTAGVLPFFHAPGFVVLIEKFKINERYRCISFGHSIGSMIFSGSAPLIGLWLWQTTNVTAIPFVYFAFLILMGYLSVRICPKTLF